MIPPLYVSMVTTYHLRDNSVRVRHDSVFYRKSEKKNDIWCATYFDGELFGKPLKVYKVNSDAPYVRDCGYYFKLDGESLQAMRDVLNH